MKNIGVFYCCFLPKRRRRRRRKNQGNNETPTLVLGTRQTKGQTFPGNPPKQNKVNKCCQTQRKTKEINACKKFVFHWKHFLPTTQPSTKSCLRDTACMMVTPQIFCCVAVDELMPLFCVSARYVLLLSASSYLQRLYPIPPPSFPAY